MTLQAEKMFARKIKTLQFTCGGSPLVARFVAIGFDDIFIVK